MDDLNWAREAKAWNRKQTMLRRLIEKHSADRRVVGLFLPQHAALHSVRIHPGGFSFQDEALRGLSEDIWRIPLKGSGHSVVWNIWHITRIEDVTMNMLVAGGTQIFRSGGWREKIGVSLEEVGNDMPDRTLGILNRRADIRALMAYRLAVGRRTRQILRTIRMDSLWEPIEPERRAQLGSEGVIRPAARWLIDYWCGRRKIDLLLMPPTRHGLVHWNEILKNRKWLQRQHN
jgi:hypothetical protein